MQDDQKTIENRVATEKMHEDGIQLYNELNTAEKMREDGNQLYNELNCLIEKGQEVLNDAEAIPTTYATTSEALMKSVEATTELLKIMPENDEIAIHLKTIVEDAKILQANLSHRADLWSQFVDERENATDQLEIKRKPLDEIGTKHIRPYEQVTDDLDKLKVCMKIFILLILPNQTVYISIS